MEKSGDNKSMGALQFLIQAFQFLKTPKAAAGGTASIALVASVAFFIHSDVNAKHEKAMAEIKENKQAVNAMVAQNQKVIATLAAIKESVDDVKGNVKQMDDRVWQIARDVYVLKTKKTEGTN